jgi:hypothetical protein
MARIFDISDEKKPIEVVKLMLETHEPKNCDQVLPDIAGLSIFTYGSHYCSVDNRDNATALACSYFNSGIRVFDIRKIDKVREIAYYNPASASAVPGSNHVMFGQWRAGGPDWCASRLDFDFAKKQLVTMCQDNRRAGAEVPSGHLAVPAEHARRAVRVSGRGAGGVGPAHVARVSVCPQRGPDSNACSAQAPRLMPLRFGGSSPRALGARIPCAAEHVRARSGASPRDARRIDIAFVGERDKASVGVAEATGAQRGGGIGKRSVRRRWKVAANRAIVATALCFEGAAALAPAAEWVAVDGG